MALFEMSLEELREAFVRHKFGSKDLRYGAFEDADVEQTLQTAVRDADRGPNYLQRKFGDVLGEAISKFSAVEFLTTRANSSSTLSWLDRAKHRGSAVYPVLKLMYEVGKIWSVHPIYSNAPDNLCCEFVLLCRGNGTGDEPYLLKHGDDRLGPVGPSTILNCLFWTMFDHYPRSETARLFILGVCQTKINAARAEAEADFNRAVAVSADGTKIVHADEVWVYRLRSPVHAVQVIFRIPSERFKDNKILRQPHKIERARTFLRPDEIQHRKGLTSVYGFVHFMGEVQESIHGSDKKIVYGVREEFVPPELLDED
ncbi:hypothetical protein KJ910_02365 [Patescibacteria group bacterium]|nr:hypothetical protein [Patescibacteria group bacterium]MBU1906861.1 hypothetical protein [Patescibacteria group bacterium]